jgi:hypothetical protein
MKRHVASFVKGVTEGRDQMSSELVPTPADVMAKATKMLQRVMTLQVVWFLCFFAGGVLGVLAAWKNTHLPALCSASGSGSLPADCAHHSYLVPVLLLLVGIVGMLVTGYVATRLAVKYLGAGAVAFLRQGRRRMGPMGNRMGPQSTGGGFPGSAGGMPPDFNAGLPPGAPGSPSGPPPS